MFTHVDTRVESWTCDYCRAERSASQQDINAEGWRRHVQGKSHIWLCDVCEPRLQALWESAKRLKV
jgi:hypothetical protein